MCSAVVAFYVLTFPIHHKPHGSQSISLPMALCPMNRKLPLTNSTKVDGFGFNSNRRSLDGRENKLEELR